jgi:glycosyltransferase involved in cell wall biosynthesis
MRKICILSVISDVYTDQRILRTASALSELDYEMIIIGRKTSSTIHHLNSYNYVIKHLQLPFKKGVGMYLFFTIQLFSQLLFFVIKNRKNKILLVANDLDTLLPNYLISKIFHLSLIYDSHELFTEVPELQNKKIKKKIWETLEKSIVPKLPFAITVNESIANWYHNKYHIPFYVIRNVSSTPPISTIKSRTDLQLPIHKKIIILQGTGINIHRGSEELVDAMQYLNEKYLLLIIGGGDVINILKQKVIELKLHNKVMIKDRMLADELFHYTANADLGISIDKPNNLNYLYSLPNKLFSYIHAHIPILATRLPEIEKIITYYQIGMFIDTHQPEHIAEKIKEALHHPEYPIWKQNTHKAAQDLNWEKEKENLKNLVLSLK